MSKELEKMADEALEEHNRGETEAMDPEEEWGRQLALMVSSAIVAGRATGQADSFVLARALGLTTERMRESTRILEEMAEKGEVLSAPAPRITARDLLEECALMIEKETGVQVEWEGKRGLYVMNTCGKAWMSVVSGIRLFKPLAGMESIESTESSADLRAASEGYAHLAKIRDVLDAFGGRQK